MCKIVEEYGDLRAAEALQQGIEKGEQKKAIKDAIALLKEKITPETIAKCVELPLEKVLELQQKYLVHA